MSTRVGPHSVFRASLPPRTSNHEFGARISTRITIADLDLAPKSSELAELVEFEGRSVLLATDGSPASAAATHVAYALAREHRAVVHAISVIDTRPAILPASLDLALANAGGTLGAGRQARQLEVMRDSLAATVGASVDWPLRVVVGAPAAAITQEALRVRASLIVTGLRRHGPLDRAVHDETTLSVIRRATCPVLAVTATTHTLPTRVLAALDFGRSSTTAARGASRLVVSGGSVVLAYVPPITGESMDEGEALIRELGIAAAFDRCQSELGSPAARVDRAVLHHKLPQSTAKLLLEYAAATKADLVAAGSMRQRRIDRWLLGSVSTELVRDGRRSVLIVPPVDEPEDVWEPA
jgi:nucleotide-binding universal stress UspA family protein